MELKQQLQTIIDEAPLYGIAPAIMANAIASGLESVARQLAHLEYYVLQNLSEDWIISVISNNKQREKKVIYAFSTLQDAKNFNTSQETDVVAISLPVVQILFRLFSVQQIDSIIFFERAGNPKGVELKRRDLQALLQQQIQQLKTTPPDLA